MHHNVISYHKYLLHHFNKGHFLNKNGFQFNNYFESVAKNIHQFYNYSYIIYRFIYFILSYFMARNLCLFLELFNHLIFYFG